MSNPNSTVRREQRARDNEGERLGLKKQDNWMWNVPRTGRVIKATGSIRKRVWQAWRLDWKSPQFSTMTAAFVYAELCNWGQDQ